MSYDLYFTPRTGSITPDQFTAYFSQRTHYKLDLPQAWYQNESTGVYFVLDLHAEGESQEHEGPHHPVSLNINYFRPSYFILEAEPEITAFVRAFDLLVSDPQIDGMGQGEYDPRRLISGWQQGNELGYAAILGKPDNREPVNSLPTSVLMNAWRWNLNRHTLQEKLGTSKFVPLIVFVALEGRPGTAVVWGDGIPMAIPQVDYLFVPRRELAPRKFFRRVEDCALIRWNDAWPVLNKFRSPGYSEFLVLDYDQRPREVTKFVESLPTDKSGIKGIPADEILDRELVEKHTPRG